MKIKSCARYLVAASIGLVSTTPIAIAGATPTRSSISSQTDIVLAGVDESDQVNLTESQRSELELLGPVVSNAVIDSEQGYYNATVRSIADFLGPDMGTFAVSSSYSGEPAPGDIEATSFRHTLNGIFEYEFSIPTTGSVNLSGILQNGGPSAISYFGFIQVFTRTDPDGEFDLSIYDRAIHDLDFNGETFNETLPLISETGSYLVLIRLSHNGLSQLDSDLSVGSLIASWDIQSGNGCDADLNQDDELDFFDITYFISAFLNRDPVGDFNHDGSFDFFDLAGFIGEFSDGCP